MKKRHDVSREYLDAGGDQMAPVEAERHFAERLREIKANIQGLSLAEQFRLVADFVDAGKAVAPELVLSLARYAVAELERRGR